MRVFVFTGLFLVAASVGSARAQAPSQAQSGAQSGAQSAARDDAVARSSFQAGKVAYEAGDFDQALTLFEQAHARSGLPELLFNIGQTADRLRDDQRALAAFRGYLQQLPEAPNRVSVEARIAALERAQAERSAQPGSGSPTSALSPERTAAAAQSAQAAPVAATAASDSESVTEQWWFWTGIGSVVLGGTAIALAVALGGETAQEPAYRGNGGSLRGP